jgi:hypothetical protein
MKARPILCITLCGAALALAGCTRRDETLVASPPAPASAVATSSAPPAVPDKSYADIVNDAKKAGSAEANAAQERSDQANAAQSPAAKPAQ